MDLTKAFSEILQEIKTVSNKVEELSDKIPKEQPLKRYSPKDIADNTPLTVQTVRAAIKDGRIKAQRFGRKLLITQQEFDRVCEDVKSIKYQRG